MQINSTPLCIFVKTVIIYSLSVITTADLRLTICLIIAILIPLLVAGGLLAIIALIGSSQYRKKVERKSGE